MHLFACEILGASCYCGALDPLKTASVAFAPIRNSADEVLRAYVVHSDPWEVKRLYADMQRRRVPANAATFLSVAHAYAAEGGSLEMDESPNIIG